LSELPYRYSKITRQGFLIHSENNRFKDRFLLNYKVDQQLKEKTALDKWLTERYALFQYTGTSINAFEIHHSEWPIHSLDIIEFDIEYPRFEKFLNISPDLMHYSTGVQVIAWKMTTSQNTKSTAIICK
jgi:uncharacterized protein YqjF (DUF2071 family)